MPDRDGYPTEEELAKVRTWDWRDPDGWFAYVRSIWHWYELGPHEAPCEDGGRVAFECATGGWSGNEEIIGAMKENLTLWGLTAYSWRRGGRYEFRYTRRTKEGEDA